MSRSDTASNVTAPAGPSGTPQAEASGATLSAEELVTVKQRIRALEESINRLDSSTPSVMEKILAMEEALVEADMLLEALPKLPPRKYKVVNLPWKTYEQMSPDLLAAGQEDAIAYRHAMQSAPGTSRKCLRTWVHAAMTATMSTEVMAGLIWPDEDAVIENQQLVPNKYKNILLHTAATTVEEGIFNSDELEDFAKERLRLAHEDFLAKKHHDSDHPSQSSGK